MKTFFLLCSLVFAMSLTSCHLGPKDLAEKYMELVCKTDELYKSLDKAKDEKERQRVQEKIDKLAIQLEKLNTEILEKYQGDENAMETILEVAENYQCEKK